MYTYMNLMALDISKKEKLSYQKLCGLYMEHKFDILGSGLKKAWYGNSQSKYQYRCFSKGLVSRRNCVNFILAKWGTICFQIKKLIACKYEPINWFVDLKSGFVFHPLYFRSSIKCRNASKKFTNVDIKGPWELGRCYHLPQMAIYAVNTELEEREKLICEFKNEILDFISMNPQKKTVQWTSVMDVAVRAVNWLTAFDIFRQIDSSDILGGKFEKIFSNYLYQSGKYIIGNFEFYGKGNNTNHYLSNIVGLAYIAAYLPESEETISWLAFCRQEIIEETLAQFNEEGSHKEASTCYHRLSAEFICYTIYILLNVYRKRDISIYTNYDDSYIDRLLPFRRQKYKNIDKQLFPEELYARIYNILYFTKACINNEGEAIQIGDNDSGRLLKLSLSGKWKAGIYKDSSLNFMPLINSIKGLLGMDGDTKCIEYNLFKDLGCKCWTNMEPFAADTFKTVNGLETFLPYAHLTKWECPGKVSLKKGLKMEQYPSFGIVVIRSERLYAAFVVDTTKGKRLGHAHNDKLSFTMYVDGKQLCFDNGSYAYTGNREARNFFRSTKAHNTIFVDGVEQNEFVDFFKMNRKSFGEIIKISENEIIAYASYRNVRHIRRLVFDDFKIEVFDFCNQKFRVCFVPHCISKGYGEIEWQKKNA